MLPHSISVYYNITLTKPQQLSHSGFSEKTAKGLDRAAALVYNGQKSGKGERIVKATATAMMNMMEMCMCIMCMRRRAQFPMCFLVS